MCFRHIHTCVYTCPPIRAPTVGRTADWNPISSYWSLNYRPSCNGTPTAVMPVNMLTFWPIRSTQSLQHYYTSTQYRWFGSHASSVSVFILMLTTVRFCSCVMYGGNRQTDRQMYTWQNTQSHIHVSSHNKRSHQDHFYPWKTHADTHKVKHY